MANERAWDAIGPLPFIADGGADGVVRIASVSGLRVRQHVIISSGAQPTLQKLEIKRVLSPTKIIVGPIETKGEFLSRANLSAYLVADGASIKVIDQKKSKPTAADILSFVYEPEAVVAIRTFGVDQLGRPWDADNPFPIEGTFVATSDAPTEQQIQNIPFPNADTEVVIDLPDGTKRYQLRVRDDAAKGRLAFAPTETTNNFWTLTRGTIIDSHTLNLPISSKLYVSLSKDNMVLEVISWVKP